MTKEELYAVWSPDDSIWSPWVKSVLFAHFGEHDLQTEMQTVSIEDWRSMDVSWLGDASQTVVVADLPGAESVRFGLALAQIGFRPVPLFNACLPDSGWPKVQEVLGALPVAMVDVRSILVALRTGAEVLQQFSLPPNSPPAFLLDANRRGVGILPDEEDFDNRSVSFPTDFPSANFLLARGLRRAVLVQRSGVRPQADLAHTLRRWQDAGIEIQVKLLDGAEGPPTPLIVERPTRFGLAWYRFLELLGFRRNLLGGFGGVVPEQGAG